jgi:radical SAM superfamily enzyme YgiQ (UPF0313 family)
MGKSKVLIIYPSQLYAPGWGRVNPVKPHLLSLFSFLLSRRIPVRVLDLECELGRPQNPSQLRQFEIKAEKIVAGIDFDLAAISCYTSLNYLSSVMIAGICKKINPQSINVVGGYHPSALPEDFTYKNTPFDFIVKGEGEQVLADISQKKMPRGQTPRCLQGTPLNLKNGLPLRWKEYGYSNLNQHLHLYLSRGCPFHCAFCSEFCKGASRWRAYPAAKAVGQIKALINLRSPSKIGISDACFGFNPVWRRSFLRLLIKNRVDKILGLECRVDILEKQDIDLLSRLNVNVIFGLESASVRMLRILRKASSPKQYLNRCINTLSYMNAREIPYTIYLVFNHPGETFSTYSQTIAFLRNFISSQKSMSGYIVAQNYAFFPGSHTFNHLQDHARRYGTVVAHPQWWKEKQDHARIAKEIIASKHLSQKTSGGNFWEKDILDLNHQLFEKMPPGIKAFWWDAGKKSLTNYRKLKQKSFLK